MALSSSALSVGRVYRVDKSFSAYRTLIGRIQGCLVLACTAIAGILKGICLLPISNGPVMVTSNCVLDA